MNKVYQRINWQNEPSISTPLNETNLNKIDYALDVVDGRVVTFDTTKANQSDLLQTVKTVAYNTTTGVFTFTFWNGNTVTADLNIEKIPVDFSMDEYGVITMTTADGTTYTCDISELIKLYTFNDSSEIDFTTTTDASGNKTITASIVSGSITGDKLQPNYLADCVSAKNDAETAETNAGQSAINSELSSEDSEAWAVGERNGQPVPSTDPAYQNNAKWWAQHGTGSSFAGLSDTNFTNLQNGQIAKYNSTTQKWENAEDAGGIPPKLLITSEAGSTVRVTLLPSETVSFPVTQVSSGHWECELPDYGEYRVHAVINGDDAVRDVTVDTCKEYVIHDEHYSYTLNVYAPTGSTITVSDGQSETYIDTGAGSTAVAFVLHQASTLYTITVTYDGLSRQDTITSSATTGGSGSKTITFGTINLTLDEDLIGETITMAKGLDTVSKVASSTSMVFYPNATGNWTISCEYDGETVYAEPDPIVVSSLSTPVSAELSLVKIPEGATVTPTDDIQTWLACANITDKSYTTLAEVLADRETFETLIADSNACDYMARSTTWAYRGLVPAMTSNSAPSGECFASSVHTDAVLGSQAWNAFDRNFDKAWHANAQQAFPQSVGYKFTSATEVKGAKARPLVYLGNSRLKQYKYQASNDNSTWVDVTEVLTADNQTTGTKMPQTDCYAGSWVETAFTKNIGSYLYYRLVVNSAWDSNKACIVEVQFYSDADITTADITTNQDAMSLIGKYDYCSNALLSNATWASAIVNSDYWDSVLQPLVPNMTSATTPSGEVISSGYATNYDAWKAFDGNNSTQGAVSQGADGYIGYKFTKPVRVCKVHFDDSAGNKRLKTYKIQGSNTGNTNDWHDISEELTVPSSFIVDESFFSNVDYEYTRIQQLTTQTAGQGNISYYTIQFYGRASSNVSNTNGIIHTANGDTVTCNGNTYVADTNGIVEIDFSDFDEGTYTFTSSIAKNPSDLSQDYTKQFRITKSPYGGTTELYLMPDTVKTLYWWGYEDENLEDCSTANGWVVGYTNYGFNAPTHNTNYIAAYSNHNNNTSAIGTKNAISGNKAHAVTQGITPISNIYINFEAGNSKTISQMDDIVYTYSTSMEHTELNLSDLSQRYIMLGTGATRKGDLYALWYE